MLRNENLKRGCCIFRRGNGAVSHCLLASGICPLQEGFDGKPGAVCDEIPGNGRGLRLFPIRNGAFGRTTVEFLVKNSIFV